MTTQRAWKQWTAPLLSGDPGLVIRGRELIFTPVRHVLRKLVSYGSSSKVWPSVYWAVVPLFMSWGISGGSRQNELLVGPSDSPDFPEKFLRHAQIAIEQHLRHTEAIQSYWSSASLGAGSMFPPVTDFPLAHGILLAALGQLEAADEAVSGGLAALEQQSEAHRQRGLELLKTYRGRGVGALHLDFARSDQAVADRANTLLIPLRARDRAGVASVLHAWERENVVRLGLEAWWEPTPFPLETSGTR